jgi:predicted negative regulator of RcsB-dependent stress response
MHESGLADVLIEQGRMDLRMRMVEKRQEKMAQDIEQIRADVHEVRLLVAEAKGAWRAALTVAGIAGAVIGALVSFAVQIVNALGGR